MLSTVEQLRKLSESHKARINKQEEIARKMKEAAQAAEQAAKPAESEGE